MTRTALHYGFRLGLALVLSFSFLFARLNYRSAIQSRQLRTPAHTQVELPSSSTLRALFLNFDPFAADLAWIWSVVYYGQHRNAATTPAYLHHNADTIADLDPRLYDVYNWFSATYLQVSYPPSLEDVETVNAFLERGMEHFPTDYRLPYDAGMNYVGYAQYRPPRERLREMNRGIDYLQRAARLEGSPDSIPLTVSWMYDQRQRARAKLNGTDTSASSDKLTKSQLEFFTDIYYTVADKSVRRSILGILRRSGHGVETLRKQARRYSRQYRRHRLSCFSYVPSNLWPLVGPKTP